jgi:hypothetical protein
MRSFYLFLLLILISIDVLAQPPATDTSNYKTIVAAKFKETNLHQWLWGRNHRKEWATPIRVPILWLDNAYGGLKPYEKGGGNESKTLHLRNKDGKEYTLHSIRKSRKDVMPPSIEKTFIEDILNDAISLSHPYGAFALPVMLENAGIYHPVPSLVYVPHQAALDTFDKKYGNELYLLEQKPEGDWKESDNLGNFEKFVKSDKVIENKLDDNKNISDQHAFIKARLFDMLIADWDRHKENWSWGKVDSGNEVIYKPVPRDRDQAFFTVDGILIKRIISIAKLDFMQNFDYRYKNIKTFNWESRNFDRFFANEMTSDDWQNAAKSLQQSLTDEVITQSIHQLPPEIFAVSGNELIDKLKVRRNKLVDVATEYYLFIAKEVEIVGSKEREYFDVNRDNTGETTVSVFRIHKGEKENEPYYHRIFKPNETKEIRIYGIGGEDVFNVRGNSKAITIRIIGSMDKDSIMQTGSKIYIYDDKNNVFEISSAKMHLSPDSSIHEYKYEKFQYNIKGFRPVLFYNHDDHLYVGLNYHFTNNKWRREPFATKQKIGVNYSLSQKGFSALYSALYPKVIAGWDMELNANYDAIRWTNFFGFGNESVFEKNSINYYRMRSKEWLASLGLVHPFGKSTISITGYFQSSKILNDTDRFAAKFFHFMNPKVFSANNYAGLRLTYSYYSLNDSIVPTKGFTFISNAALTRNFTEKDFFQKYDARLQAYIPFGKKFSFAMRVGGATIVNNSSILDAAQAYQYAVIGGAPSLRGYRIERFWGKTSFYNNNELRFITDLKTYLVNGKIGFLVFFDDGRVWIPNENSNVLHTSYGGGILIAPYHLINLTVTYGISKETRLFQVKINTAF